MSGKFNFPHCLHLPRLPKWMSRVPQEPKPLLELLGGRPAPMTPTADEAEKAAEALLESFAKGEKVKKGKSEKEKTVEKGSKEYYQELSEKIREAHAAEARAARRYISHIEQRLHTAASSDALGGSLAKLESGLFEHQDAVEREGGELKKRWQHCLAEVIVRQMQAVTDDEEQDEAKSLNHGTTQ